MKMEFGKNLIKTRDYCVFVNGKGLLLEICVAPKSGYIATARVNDENMPGGLHLLNLSDTDFIKYLNDNEFLCPYMNTYVDEVLSSFDPNVVIDINDFTEEFAKVVIHDWNIVRDRYNETIEEDKQVNIACYVYSIK